jgi:hypothetical protein
VQQVLQLTSQVERAGDLTLQVRSFVTSLPPRVSAHARMPLVRGHWGIENRMHDVREVTRGGDASQIRAGAAPQALAELRNIVLAMLRLHGWTNIAAAVRHYAWTRARRPGSSSWSLHN